MKTPGQSINLTFNSVGQGMNLKVKAFGITKDIVGEREINIKTDGQSVAELRYELNTKYPALLSLKSLFIAVNNIYAHEQTMLKESDEIALIPPVSGG